MVKSFYVLLSRVVFNILISIFIKSRVEYINNEMSVRNLIQYYRTSIIINTNVVSEIACGINMDCCYL